MLLLFHFFFLVVLLLQHLSTTATTASFARRRWRRLRPLAHGNDFPIQFEDVGWQALIKILALSSLAFKVVHCGGYVYGQRVVAMSGVVIVFASVRITSLPCPGTAYYPGHEA